MLFNASGPAHYVAMWPVRGVTAYRRAPQAAYLLLVVPHPELVLLPEVDVTGRRPFARGDCGRLPRHQSGLAVSLDLQRLGVLDTIGISAKPRHNCQLRMSVQQRGPRRVPGALLGAAVRRRRRERAAAGSGAGARSPPRRAWPSARAPLLRTSARRAPPFRGCPGCTLRGQTQGVKRAGKSDHSGRRLMLHAQRTVPGLLRKNVEATMPSHRTRRRVGPGAKRVKRSGVAPTRDYLTDAKMTVTYTTCTTTTSKVT